MDNHTNTTQFSPLVDEEYERGVAIQNERQKLPPPSRQTRFVFDVTVRILLTGIVTVFGVMSNVVNIVVFYRQGPMSSSPVVILMGLAVSDLFVSIFGLIDVAHRILFWSFGPISIGWYLQHLYVICGERPCAAMIQVSCWITALLTLERAVSVTFPFKVKVIFKPRRSIAVVVTIVVLTVVIHILSLTQHKVAWIKMPSIHPVRFKVAVYSHLFPPSLFQAFLLLNGIILRFACVFIIALCNIVIAWKVRSSQRFRQSKPAASTTNVAPRSRHTQEDNTQAGEKKETTTSKESKHQPSAKHIKDLKLLRMIIVVAGVFLFTYSFVITYTVLICFVYTVYVDFNAIFGNMMFTLVKLLEHFNSGINAVIYFSMSATYKEELLALCGRQKR